MAGNSSHLLLISLALSSLIISLNAIPISRSAHLLHENPEISSKENSSQQNVEEKFMNGGSIGLDGTDYYPGSGSANDRHTPKPPS
nr:uncharacterized protein LOC104597668 [Ipomoea batatas]